MDRERMWIGIVVFGVTYALIASRRMRWIRIDRPAGALIGAVLAVALESVTPQEAASAIDHSTIVLLLAGMGVGAFLSIDGFFDRAAGRLGGRARTPAPLRGPPAGGARGPSGRLAQDP